MLRLLGGQHPRRRAASHPFSPLLTPSHTFSHLLKADNILNDGQLCWSHCLSKFVRAANAGHFAQDPCLQCDEYTSGVDAS